VSILPEKARWDRWILLAVLGWTFLLGCVPMSNFDIWWHLRTGQWIVENRAIPQIDLYTFMDRDKPWTDLHWGFQILVWGLYSLGGVNLLIVARAAFLTAAVGIGWSAAGNKLPASVRAACWIPAVICLAGRAVIRPEMISLVFLASWFWILSRSAQKPRLIWWLPLLQLVWINSHALFVLGLVVWGAYLTDRIVRSCFGGRWGLEPAPSQPEPMVLLCVSMLLLLASLANPYFEEGAIFPLTLYRKFSVDQAFYSVRIGEFTPPLEFVKQNGWASLGNLYFDAQLLLGLVTLLSFVRLAIRRRVNVMRLLLFAGFAHLAWKASRNTSIFALTSAVILNGNWEDLRQFGQSRSTGFFRTLSAWMLILLCGLCVVFVTGLWSRIDGEGRRFGFGVPPGLYSHAAAKFAGQRGLPPRAFVAHFGHAAIYIFHNGPGRTVFMDGRLEVATRATFERFDRIRNMMARGDGRWVNLLPQGQTVPTTIILDSRTARREINGLFNTPGWRLVFADSAAAVFVSQDVADELYLPQADHTPLLHPP